MRFVIALGLGGLQLVLEALLWIASMWLLVGLFEHDRPSFLSALRVMGLSYAPLLLGVLVFLPYIGPILARLFRLWALLAAVVGISVAFGLRPDLAALAAIVGFALRWALLYAFGALYHRVLRMRA